MLPRPTSTITTEAGNTGIVTTKAGNTGIGQQQTPGHCISTTEITPAGHGNGVLDAAPTGQYVPATALHTPSHVTDPVALANLPAGHRLHTLDPAALYRPGRHASVHASADSATRVPYRPAGHG